MKKWIIPVVVLLIAGATVYFSRPKAAAPAEEKPLPTVPVTRGDLVSSVQQPGQLGYTGTVQLVGARQGTVTAVPAIGQVIGQGASVYAVDQRPIPLFFGTLPFYRTLTTSVSGEDVRQLERNLVDLGYAHLTPDDTFTTSTANAVKHWQHALGVPETGTVEPGDAVVAPGSVRVTAVNDVVGAQARAGSPLATGTSTEHGVHVDLDRRYLALVTVDQRVKVQMFGGKSVDGVVRTVGSSAAQPNNQQQTVPVDIAVTSPEADLGGVFEGPVTVLFPGESRHNVLTVPVEALTVLPGGAYAVVVVDAAGRRPVQVTPGLFTASRVEITGVAEGTRVEVPTL